MVSSIVPGAPGAGLAVDPRATRSMPLGSSEKPEVANQRNDSVDVGDAASWAASRESVRVGLSYVREALTLAREAQIMLLQVQSLVQNEGPQGDLDALLQSYAERAEQAARDSAGLTDGGDVSVSAEPGAPPARIDGVDLRLGGQVIALAGDAALADGIFDTAQRSFEALQGATERLMSAARALEAHQGILGAAEGALAANPDLDADGARLLALQVRQGLSGGGAIANVEPQAVLALFRN